MKLKPTKLKNLVVEELAFVDRGANQGANILLYKRKDDTINSSDQISLDKRGILQGDHGMTLEELAKTLVEVSTGLAALTESVTKSQTDLAAVASKVETLEKGKFPAKEEEGDKPKADEEAAKKKLEQDELEKAIPESLRKQMDELRKSMEEAKKGQEEALTIAKAEREARELMSLEKRAETELPNVPGTPTQKAQLLKQIEGMPEDLKKFALETLTATNESVGKSFDEIGTSAAPSVAIGKKAALDKLDALAKARQATDKDLTYEKAYSEVLATPDGAKYYKEMNA